MTLRTLNYGNYGIFLIMGHAGFISSTVVLDSLDPLDSFWSPAGLKRTCEPANGREREREGESFARERERHTERTSEKPRK